VNVLAVDHLFTQLIGTRKMIEIKMIGMLETKETVGIVGMTETLEMAETMMTL
jgi:hypothetical protein